MGDMAPYGPNHRVRVLGMRRRTMTANLYVKCLLNGKAVILKCREYAVARGVWEKIVTPEDAVTQFGAIDITLV